MNITKTRLILLGLCVFSGIDAVSPVSAEGAVPSVPRQISFQAKVTDAGGSPVSDGMHSASFALYGYRSGGTEIWSQGAVMVTTAGGLFTYSLGSGTELPLTLSDADSLWLEITFEAEVQSPRIQLMSSPSANVADGLEVRSPNGDFTVIRTDRANGDLVLGDPNSGNDKVKLGTEGGQFGRLRLNGFATGYVQLEASGPFFTGPELEMRTGNGSQSAVLTPDNDGSLIFTRGDGTTGAFIAGGGFGGQMALNNSAGTGVIVLDAGLTGNNAVQVPSGSISGVEIESNSVSSLRLSDEPGVVSDVAPSVNSLDPFPTVEVLDEVDFDAPSPGYVVGIATLMSSCGHSNGTFSKARFAMDMDGTTMSSNSQVTTQVPSSLPTQAGYDYVVTIHDIFVADVGTHTLRLLGQEETGQWSVSKCKLTAMFFPTTYGAVIK